MEDKTIALLIVDGLATVAAIAYFAFVKQDAIVFNGLMTLLGGSGVYHVTTK